MKKTVLVAAIVATAVVAQADTLFGVRGSDDTLVRIDISDPNNPTATDVGPLGTGFAFGGLAWDSNDGVLYMIGGRGNNSLYTVDTDTGAATLVGSHGLNDLFGLAYDSSTGTLYAADRFNTRSLYTLSQTDGSASLVGLLDPSQSADGLAYDSSRDRLVGVFGGAGDFYEYDRSNGNGTLLNDGDFLNNGGLAYDADNDTYWYLEFGGELTAIDPDTFSRAEFGLAGGGQYDGLTWVPAPGAFGLLAVGGFAATRRRRA